MTPIPPQAALYVNGTMAGMQREGGVPDDSVTPVLIGATLDKARAPEPLNPFPRPGQGVTQPALRASASVMIRC